MLSKLSKVLSHAGVCSRRQGQSLILEGRVSVDGHVVRNPAECVGPHHTVRVDGGEPLPRPSAERARLWRYHKPAGLLCTHNDVRGRPTIFEALPSHLPRVLSVGRLDLETEGLLLLTDSGDLKRLLELPASGYVRRYHALLHTGRQRAVTASVQRRRSHATPTSRVCAAPVLHVLRSTCSMSHTPRPVLHALAHPSRVTPPQMIKELSDGLLLNDGTRFRPIRAELANEALQPAPGTSRRQPSSARVAPPPEHVQWVDMRLTEGKNQEVRKAWRHFGFPVTRLVRVAFGPFELGRLRAGQVDAVQPTRVRSLLKRFSGDAVEDDCS